MTKEMIPCQWCGTPTRMLGTKECDRCWELRSRIQHDMSLAKQMLRKLCGYRNDERHGAPFSKSHRGRARRDERRFKRAFQCHG